jgi:hypothetical protein
MARKNIKVPEDLFLALRDDKDDEQSWPHYLEQRCLVSDDGGGLTYDDAKNACAAAIQDELTREVLRR